MINAATDWGRLARALAFYRSRGFLEADLDWHAPAEVCGLTCPDIGRMYEFGPDVLVGSAEQSFMNCQKKGLLPPGRYVALTPCFRREDEETETHRRHFMKVELFASHVSRTLLAREFACLAREFMSRETTAPVDLVETPEGFDLEIGGMEVGSYSARSAGGMDWTCGTGLAEPRFSVATANAEAH